MPKWWPRPLNGGCCLIEVSFTNHFHNSFRALITDSLIEGDRLMEAQLYSFFNANIDLLYLFLHTSVR